MQIKAPRLLINRHGVYYFRYKSEGVEKRISLRTKCSNTANIIALKLNLDIERQRAMTNPKLPQTSFHSFRVNVITELHNKNANAGKIFKIVGHKDGSGGGQAVHWGYVRDLPDCKEIVDLLRWPIDHAALKYDGRFNAFVSDQRNWAVAKEKKADAKPQSKKKKSKP